MKTACHIAQTYRPVLRTSLLRKGKPYLLVAVRDVDETRFITIRYSTRQAAERASGAFVRCGYWTRITNVE